MVTFGRSIKIDSKQFDQSVRLAQKEDRELVVDILMSAFLDLDEGNSLNYFIRGEKNRPRRVKTLFKFLFDKSLKTGEIYLSDNEKGCILVDKSYKNQYSFLLFLKKLRTIFLSIGLRSVPRITKRQRLLDKNHNEKRYVYPTAMGVHKSIKDKGTCVRMIHELIRTYDDGPMTVYTETTTKQNLRIYRRFGFKVHSESNELGFKMYFLSLRLGEKCMG